MSNRTWTLTEALALVRDLEEHFSTVADGERFHFALGGSVLHKGESKKDLDIFVYPRKKPDAGWGYTYAAMAIGEYLSLALRRCTRNKEEEPQYRDAKNVCYAYTSAGKRIDFFFLS
jgi:hypothetical protein